MELKIPEKIFNKVISQAPVNYTVFELDLGNYRNNQEFFFHGNIFQILELSENAVFNVKFNNIEHNFIEIDNYATITGLYTKFFISNEVQPNKKLKIYCGNTFYYKPNFKNTYSIIQNKIVEISNILPELSTQLNDVITSINNLENTLSYDEVVNKLNDVIISINNLKNILENNIIDNLSITVFTIPANSIIHVLDNNPLRKNLKLQNYSTIPLYAGSNISNTSILIENNSILNLETYKGNLFIRNNDNNPRNIVVLEGF